MSVQPAKVKAQIEHATTLSKAVSATQAEAKAAVLAWQQVCDNTESSSDLRALATERRRALELSVASENQGAREVALSALNAVAVQFP